MSAYSSMHICTVYDEAPLSVSVDHGTVSVRMDDHRIAVSLTLTADQFADLARVCMAQAEAMREVAA